MLHWLLRLGHGKHRTRNVMRGRRKLAEELGLVTARRRPDAPAPKGKGNHDLGGRNTRRRLERLQQLKLIHIEGPVIARGGAIVRARGGRKHGCHSERLVGRALRIYPGELLYPPALLRRQIEVDNYADADLIEWTQVSTPVDQMTPGELLVVEQLAQAALRRRGP